MPDHTLAAEDITKCYGKHRIDQKKGDSCKRRKNCPWGEMCLSLANESAEDYHYHKANISIGNMSYDPNEGVGENLSFSEKEELYARREISALSTEQQDYGNRIVELEQFNISEESYAEVCRVLEVLSQMYFNLPSAFDCTMRKIYKNQNQSDVAKEKNITRAGLNKRLLHELGIAQKRNSIQEQRDRELAQAKQRLELTELKAKSRIDSIKSMTDAEFAVYKICAEDGCLSATSVAEQTGYSRQTIYATLHNLRSKYGICLTLSPYKREKK